MPETSALGIDLGTTFSVVAQVNDAGLPAVLPNAEGSPTTPSVVLFEAGQAVVGAVAREALATEPESVVQLVKRHIGSGWEFDYGGVCYRPEHVSALILRKLALDAQLLAGPVTQAAITVPAYFNDPMRAATLRAGELAGLDVLGSAAGMIGAPRASGMPGPLGSPGGGPYAPGPGAPSGAYPSGAYPPALPPARTAPALPPARTSRATVLPPARSAWTCDGSAGWNKRSAAPA